MEIKKGNKVKAEYEGRFDNKEGEIFDSSSHGDHSHPIEFEVGAGQVIEGFDSAVMGKKVGDEVEIVLSPEQGYGNPNPELQREIPRSALPKDQEPKPGMTLVMSTPEGQQIPARITKVDSTNVTLDLNHPLAGRTLYFKIKITEVK